MVKHVRVGHIFHANIGNGNARVRDKRLEIGTRMGQLEKWNGSDIIYFLINLINSKFY
jgi:hypothetical protein